MRTGKPNAYALHTSLTNEWHRYGKKLIEMYDSYKNAELEVCQSLLKVQHVWLKLQAQLEVLQRVWDALREELKIHQQNLMHVLHSKLHRALVEFDEIIGEKHVEVDMISILRKKGSLKRGKWAIRVRKHLNQTIQELTEWHELFNPSWFLITLMPTNVVDEGLEATSQQFAKDNTRSLKNMQDLRKLMHHPPNDMELHHDLRELNLRNSSFDSVSTLVSRRTSIFLPNDVLTSSAVSIEYTTCQQAQVSDGHFVIVDCIHPDERIKARNMIESVRDLARVLSKVDIFTFGLLTCFGVVKITEEMNDSFESKLTGFDFLFSIPSGLHTPQSLRRILLRDLEGIPLNEWFELAKQLAKAVFFIHTANFVHKNIRPETIVCFQDGQTSLGKPFLVGFEKFRLEKGSTQQYGDSSWEKNMNRHPQRQGLHPEDSYVMQHDVYSLGMVLLELGLRRSFVMFDRCGDRDPQEAIPSETLQELWDEGDSLYLDKAVAHRRKSSYVALAKTRLPAKMGLRYTNVVLSCLTCLDKDNAYFDNENEFQDEDGILVGVRYIDRVCKPIS